MPTGSTCVSPANADLLSHPVSAYSTAFDMTPGTPMLPKRRSADSPSLVGLRWVSMPRMLWAPLAAREGGAAMPFTQNKLTLLSKRVCEYQGVTGFDWQAICNRVSEPQTTATAAGFSAAATTVPVLAMRVDPDASFEIAGEAGDEVDADGAVFRVRVAGVSTVSTGLGGSVYNPTVKTYKRTPLADLFFTGGSANAVFMGAMAATDTANVFSKRACDSITITADHTIADSIRISGDVADGNAVATGDYGQHEWLEFYLTCTDGADAAGADACAIAVRTL